MILDGVGFAGTDHVGLTVPDLNQAITFFEDVFGAQTIVRHDGYSPSPEVNVQNFARSPDVKVRGIAILRIAGMNFELLEYETTATPTKWPATSDAGGHHVAFYVNDLDAAVAQLRAVGLQVLGNPLDLGGDEAGNGARFVYFRAPWGLFLELVTYPSGKSYEQHTTTRLAPPH